MCFSRGAEQADRRRPLWCRAQVTWSTSHVTPGSCGVSLRRHSSNRSHSVLWLSAWPFGGQVTWSIWVSCCVVGWLNEFLWAGNVRLKFRNMCVGKFLVNRTVAMVSAFITRNQSWPQDPGALQGPERLVIPCLTLGINHMGVGKERESFIVHLLHAWCLARCSAEFSL